MQQHKVADELLVSLDAVVMAAGTTGAIAVADSAAIDLGAADVDEVNPGEFVFQVSTNMTSGGSATIQLSIVDCDTVGGTYAAITPVPIITGDIAFDDASLLVGAEPIRLPLPKYGVRQFVKFRYEIKTATITAGVINAHFAR
jgi:hypothetical protein